MKKLSFTLSAFAALTAGSVMANGANTADGTVEIRGKVVEQTCEVATSHKNLVVLLDTVGKGKLKEKAAVAGVKPFTIKLTSCTAPQTPPNNNQKAFAAFSTASLTDVVDVDDSHKGVLKNKATDDTATNVGIQLLNADGTAINLNSESAATQLAGANGGGITQDGYKVTDSAVVFGVVTGQSEDYLTAIRQAATKDTPEANKVLGKKVAGQETWVNGSGSSQTGTAVAGSDVSLEYKAQYIATEADTTAGEVEAFVSYNIAYK